MQNNINVSRQKCEDAENSYKNHTSSSFSTFKLSNHMEITEVLPDDCISLIISLTSPRDACRMALLSHAFNSIADSDAVWQMFLPLDCVHIISISSSPTSLLSLTKKDLYFSLCYHPIVINNGDMVSPTQLSSFISFSISLLPTCLCYWCWY